jgi:lipopolysaccharide assembly outer membrane protein LptD (OstA)
MSHTIAQRDTLIKKSDSVKVDSLTIGGDSINKNNDSLLASKGSIKMPLFSEAKDSVVEDFSNDRKMIYYYGDVTVRYGNLELTADYMEYNIDSQTVFARGTIDTSGNVIGLPKMKDGKSEYIMENVYYNFNSQKAKIKNMITQESEGYIHGDVIKKMPDNSININKGKYTTCELDHPHFYLKLTRARVINEPRNTVFGPAYLVVEDVPTPFFLPFGFVPKQVKRASGLLIPSVTEEAARGFGLTGLGYYFVFGDHLDFTVTSDLFSLGSYNIQVESRYKVRYKFDGGFSLNYSRNKVGEPGTEDYYVTKDFAVKWTHSQDSKAHPGTSFRASVNFSSPSNNRYNSREIQQTLQNQISSSVSYSRTFSGTPFSFSANLLHSQNSLDSSYAFTLPNLTFNVNRIYPFKRKEAAGKERFYEKIQFAYNATLDNKINFKSKEFGEADFMQKFKAGVKHNFTIGLPTFTLFKYIQFSPGVSYGMNWYFQSMDRSYDPSTDQVINDTSALFKHFGATQDYSGSLSISTRLYGMYNFGDRGKIRAIRHMITPQISLSYRPDLGTYGNGYRTLNYTDQNGVLKTMRYNIYDGLPYGYPSSGESGGLSFSVANNVEAKVKSDKDTTNGGITKIKLIDNLSFSGSYNFLADSMRLSNISATMSTTIFGSLAFNANAMFDPYAIDEKGQRINELNIVKEGGFKLARMTNASLSLSYSLSGKGERGGGQSEANKVQSPPTSVGGHPNPVYYNRVYKNPITGDYIPGGWLYYLDPSLQWSLSFNYNYSFNKSYSYSGGQLSKINSFTQTLGISGQLRMTKDLNVSLNTGFDLMERKLTTTQMSATYDLHCFQISFSWIPTGTWKSWSFRINAKASALADLLQYKKSASYWDNKR